jgi:Recombinase
VVPDDDAGLGLLDRPGRREAVHQQPKKRPERVRPGDSLEIGALISVRTKAALAAAKARGVTLGNPKLEQVREAAHEAAAFANRASADHHAANVVPIIRQIKRAGATTLREIADALNARGVRTARGGQWHVTTVSNVLARA